MLSLVMWPPYFFTAFKLAKSSDSLSLELLPEIDPEDLWLWLFDCACRTSIGKNLVKDAREYCPEDDDTASFDRQRRIIIRRNAASLAVDVVFMVALFMRYVEDDVGCCSCCFGFVFATLLDSTDCDM